MVTARDHPLITWFGMPPRRPELEGWHGLAEEAAGGGGETAEAAYALKPRSAIVPSLRTIPPIRREPILMIEIVPTSTSHGSVRSIFERGTES